MNLVSCRECRHTVSPNASTCPECGAPFPSREKWNGWGYEWKSGIHVLGYPFIHIAFGRGPDGKLRVARGIIAVGQFAIGVITIAQFGIGLLFGVGQFIFGCISIAQFAAGVYFSLGQFAFGYLAIGQIAFGYYAKCQFGLAWHLWSQRTQDPEAVYFFKTLFKILQSFFRSNPG